MTKVGISNPRYLHINILLIKRILHPAKRRKYKIFNLPATLSSPPVKINRRIFFFFFLSEIYWRNIITFFNSLFLEVNFCPHCNLNLKPLTNPPQAFITWARLHQHHIIFEFTKMKNLYFHLFAGSTPGRKTKRNRGSYYYGKLYLFMFNCVTKWHNNLAPSKPRGPHPWIRVWASFQWCSRIGINTKISPLWPVLPQEANQNCRRNILAGKKETET